MTDSRIQGRMVRLETPPNRAPLGKKTLRDAARRAPDPRQPRYRATGAGELLIKVEKENLKQRGLITSEGPDAGPSA
jgi:hypothetical protein